MRFATYSQSTAQGGHAGIVIGEHVVNASAAVLVAGRSQADARQAKTTRGLLHLLEDRKALEQAAELLVERSSEAVLAVSEVVVLTPIPDPQKIICVGLNYRDHADEAGLPVPAAPILFAKFNNALCAAQDTIEIPSSTNELDWEGELAVVIGTRCRNVPANSARSVIAGAMAANDLSARDLQNQTSQWLPGKAPDGFLPCGPHLVSIDEIDDLQNLQIITRVNGEVVQDGNTATMIFTINEIVEFITSFMTLESGDIIVTGTPAGVGFSRTPPRFLHAGDTVDVEIPEVGTVSNTLTAPRNGFAP